MNTSSGNLFSKSVLAALLAGIFATLVSLGYNMFYREYTGFPLSSLINVASLIFVINIIFLLIGLAYYGLIKTGRKGELIFIIAFIVLTVFLGWRIFYIHRSDDAVLNGEFHQLLLALDIIMGIAASLGIPYLFHNRKLDDEVFSSE